MPKQSNLWNPIVQFSHWGAWYWLLFPFPIVVPLHHPWSQFKCEDQALLILQQKSAPPVSCTSHWRTRKENILITHEKLLRYLKQHYIQADALRKRSHLHPRPWEDTDDARAVLTMELCPQSCRETTGIQILGKCFLEDFHQGQYHPMAIATFCVPVDSTLILWHFYLTGFPISNQSTVSWHFTSWAC